MTCNTCLGRGPHQVMAPEVDREEDCQLTPCVFILSDQLFLAVVPTYDDGDCLKITRIDEARLLELADYFIEVTKGFTVPAGTVVLLSSLNHLSWVGTAGYAEDFVAAKAKIFEIYGGGVQTIHGLPIPTETNIDTQLWDDHSTAVSSPGTTWSRGPTTETSALRGSCWCH